MRFRRAASSIFHAKCRAVFGLALPPVVEARRRHVGVAEPFLDLGDISFVRERVCRRRGAQRVNAQAADIAADAGLEAVFANDVAVDRCRIEMAVEAAGAVVFYWPEQGSVGVGPMSRPIQILLDRALRGRVDRDETDLVALALDPEMQDALTAVQVLDPKDASKNNLNTSHDGRWLGWPQSVVPLAVKLVAFDGQFGEFLV